MAPPFGGGGRRARAGPVVTVSTLANAAAPRRGLAAVGAIGGALVVSRAVPHLRHRHAPRHPTSPPTATETLAVPSFLPIIKSVPAETWPAAVVEGVAPGLATVHRHEPHGVTSASQW